LAWLKSSQTVGLFLDALAVEPTHLRHALEELIASFTREHRDLVHGYLRGVVRLPALAKRLLRFLVATAPSCDTTAVWDAIAPINRRLNDTIAAHLPNQCKEFTLCGYGLGDGVYEQQLAERSGACGTNIKLFGYDPTNARFDTDGTQWRIHRRLPAEMRELVRGAGRRRRPSSPYRCNHYERTHINSLEY
jgi:hypothetical protein